jgi:RNA polymerase sigma factor for flagellar operon FliA
MSAADQRGYQVERDQLVEEHRTFVRAIAAEIARNLPPHIELEELVACGNLGLVEAAQRYDPKYRTSFRTFAYYRIRGAIYDALRSMAPLTRREYSRIRFASNANDILETVAGDEHAMTDPIAASLDDEIAAAQNAIDALIPIYILSIDSEQMPDVADRHETVLDRIEQQELAALARSIVDQLPADDRQMIIEIYFKNRPISDVGRDLGVHKSWASRLHARAIKRMRELMEQQGLLTSD